MKPVYELCVVVNGKQVEFLMTADEELKVQHEITNKFADKWRNELVAIANTLFKEKE